MEVATCLQAQLAVPALAVTLVSDVRLPPICVQLTTSIVVPTEFAPTASAHVSLATPAKPAALRRHRLIHASESIVAYTAAVFPVLVHATMVLLAPSAPRRQLLKPPARLLVATAARLFSMVVATSVLIP